MQGNVQTFPNRPHTIYQIKLYILEIISSSNPEEDEEHVDDDAHTSFHNSWPESNRLLSSFPPLL